MKRLLIFVTVFSLNNQVLASDCKADLSKIEKCGASSNFIDIYTIICNMGDEITYHELNAYTRAMDVEMAENECLSALELDI